MTGQERFPPLSFELPRPYPLPYFLQISLYT